MSEESTLTPGNWRQTDLAESDVAALLPPMPLSEVSVDETVQILVKVYQDFNDFANFRVSRGLS